MDTRWSGRGETGSRDTWGTGCLPSDPLGGFLDRFGVGVGGSDTIKEPGAALPHVMTEPVVKLPSPTTPDPGSAGGPDLNQVSGAQLLHLPNTCNPFLSVL